MRVGTTAFMLQLDTLIEYLEEKRDSRFPHEASAIKADLDLNTELQGLVSALPYRPDFAHLATLNRSHQHFMVYWRKLESLCTAWEGRGEIDLETWEAEKMEIETIIEEIETAVPHDPEEVHDRTYY